MKLKNNRIQLDEETTSSKIKSLEGVTPFPVTEFYEENKGLVNKNPEKIKKTADAHRGAKRSKEAKENIFNSKSIFSTNKYYDGFYVTPLGCFFSSNEAGRVLGCDGQLIIKRCIKNNSRVIKSSKSFVLDLDKDVKLGDTWSQHGWGYIYWESKYATE